MRSDIPNRTFEFAKRIVKLCLFLDKSPGVSRTLATKYCGPEHLLVPMWKKDRHRKVMQTLSVNIVLPVKKPAKHIIG